MTKFRTLISTAAIAIALTLPTVFAANQASAHGFGGGHGWGGGFGGFHHGWGGGYGYGYIGYGGYDRDHPRCIIGLPCHWRYSEY